MTVIALRTRSPIRERLAASVSPEVDRRRAPPHPRAVLRGEPLEPGVLVVVGHLPPPVERGAPTRGQRLEALCCVEVRLDAVVDDVLELAQGLLVLGAQHLE